MLGPKRYISPSQENTRKHFSKKTQWYIWSLTSCYFRLKNNAKGKQIYRRICQCKSTSPKIMLIWKISCQTAANCALSFYPPWTGFRKVRFIPAASRTVSLWSTACLRITGFQAQCYPITAKRERLKDRQLVQPWWPECKHFWTHGARSTHWSTVTDWDRGSHGN